MAKEKKVKATKSKNKKPGKTGSPKKAKKSKSTSKKDTISKAKDIMSDAIEDWTPEKKPLSPELDTTSTEDIVMIDDPFQIPTPEIEQAQNFEGELVLDEEDPKELERISSAMKKEETKQKKRRKKEKKSEKTDAEAELARQIEEDIALEEEQAAQAKEVEELEAAAEESKKKAKKSKKKKKGKKEEEILSPEQIAEVQSHIETLLFVADKPISEKKLKELVGIDEDSKEFSKLFNEALKELRESYQSNSHGIEISKLAGGLQFRTKPATADVAKRLVKVQPQRLSRGAMETLSIVAYKQPVMKDDIDTIRGVDSTHFVRGLLDKRLIMISGRSELPGRPMLYKTTPEFLEIFGIANLNELPPLQELEKMIPSSEASDEERENEDPKVKQLRELVGKMNMDKGSLAYDPAEDDKLLKEIRENVKKIPTSTPYLVEEDRKEKEAKEAAKNPQPELAEAVEADTDAASSTEQEQASGSPNELIVNETVELADGATPETQREAESINLETVEPANASPIESETIEMEHPPEDNLTPPQQVEAEPKGSEPAS